jgi:hypothetical protein
MGGQATFLAAIAWLIKTVITAKLAKDAEIFRVQLKADADKGLESFRIGLQANTDVEIERLRSSLHIAAEEQKVGFTRLHEKRGIVIARLYKLIVEAADASQLYVHQGTWKDAPIRSNEFYKLRRRSEVSRDTSKRPESICRSESARLLKRH